MHGVARIIAWGAGSSYLAIWTVLLWFMTDGALIRGHAACEPVRLWEVLAFWSCATTDAVVFIANLVNIALAVTLWAPAFVALALNDSAAWMIAGPILGFHFGGLPAAVYVMLRAGTRIFDGLRGIRSVWADRAWRP